MHNLITSFYHIITCKILDTYSRTMSPVTENVSIWGIHQLPSFPTCDNGNRTGFRKVLFYIWVEDGWNPNKRVRLFCNMIHHLQSPIAMISPFFVNTRAHCWIIFRDNEILALGYSLHKNQVVTCLCSQRTLTSEKTLWYFILLSQSIQILPVAGRWC